MSIRKHTAYNLMGAVLPIGLSLVTIPIYVGIIGEARYGVLAIAWLLLGYFGLFDLGLGRATAQRIASLGNAERDQLAMTFWTALAMNAGLGVVGGLVIWPVANYFFGQVFSVEAVLQPELDSAIPWLVLAVPLATLSGVLSGALEGRSRFLELNVISVFGSALIQLLPLAVAWRHGPDLAWLLPAVILSRLVTLTLLFLRCKVHVFQGVAPQVSRALAKSLLQFGGWVTVTSLVGPMMVILDRFVIGSALGPKAVTHYTVPFQLAERTTILPGALSTALFPRLAATGPAEGRQLASMAIRSLAVVMTPAMLVGILLIEPFLTWWLSQEFAARAGLTAQILLLGFWINAFARVPYAQLQAAALPDLVAKCHLGELIPYLLALYAGLHFWGLPGAAAAFGLRAFADCVLLLWLAGSLRVAFSALGVPVLQLLLGLTVAVTLPAGGGVWWLATLGLLAVSLAWAWRSAPIKVRRLVMKIVNR